MRIKATIQAVLDIDEEDYNRINVLEGVKLDIEEGNIDLFEADNVEVTVIELD